MPDGRAVGARDAAERGASDQTRKSSKGESAQTWVLSAASRIGAFGCPGSGFCCDRNFSSLFFRFRAAFPSGFLLFAMLAKHLTTQCESYMRSSTASILANGVIRIYLNVFSAESSLTNYLSSNKPDHVDKTDRSFFDDSHLRTQHQRTHVEGSQ